jgi:hypothetical protein
MTSKICESRLSIRYIEYSVPLPTPFYLIIAFRASHRIYHVPPQSGRDVKRHKARKADALDHSNTITNSKLATANESKIDDFSPTLANLSSEILSKISLTFPVNFYRQVIDFSISISHPV